MLEVGKLSCRVLPSNPQRRTATQIARKDQGPGVWGAGRRFRVQKQPRLAAGAETGIGAANSECATGRTGNRATSQPHEHAPVGRPALDGSQCGYGVFNICMRNWELPEN